MTSAQPDPSVWDPKYPVARNLDPSKITRAEILVMLQSGQRMGKDLLLIDLRREDLTVQQFNIRQRTRAYCSREAPLKARSTFRRKRCIQASLLSFL